MLPSLILSITESVDEVIIILPCSMPSNAESVDSDLHEAWTPLLSRLFSIVLQAEYTCFDYFVHERYRTVMAWEGDVLVHGSGA